MEGKTGSLAEWSVLIVKMAADPGKGCCSRNAVCFKLRLVGSHLARSAA